MVSYQSVSNELLIFNRSFRSLTMALRRTPALLFSVETKNYFKHVLGRL